MANKKFPPHCKTGAPNGTAKNAAAKNADKLVYWKLTMILDDGTIVEERAGMQMEPEHDMDAKTVRWIDLAGSMCEQGRVKSFSRSLKTDDDVPNCAECRGK